MGAAAVKAARQISSALSCIIQQHWHALGKTIAEHHIEDTSLTVSEAGNVGMWFTVPFQQFTSQEMHTTSSKEVYFKLVYALI
jgi:hypothetical protein